LNAENGSGVFVRGAFMLKELAVPKKKIADFCRRWKITEFALFGSVLREDFGPESDIDVLVTRCALESARPCGDAGRTHGVVRASCRFDQ
jgi:hypothetical protein